MTKCLCSECRPGDSTSRWYPSTAHPTTRTENIISNFLEDISILKHKQDHARNITYNLGYVEYLDKTLVDLNLSTLLSSSTHKTSVITSVGIIESLLFYVLLKQSLHLTIKKKRRRSKDKRHTIDGKTYLYEAYETITTTEPQRMTFDEIIQVATKNRLLGEPDSIYQKHLPDLQALRNKVHLQKVDNHSDTDYMKFSKIQSNLAKKIIYRILVTHFNLSPDDQTMLNFLIKS